MKRIGLVSLIVAQSAILNLPQAFAAPTNATTATLADRSSPGYIVENREADTPAFNFDDVARNDLAIFLCPSGLCVVDRTSPAYGIDQPAKAFRAALRTNPALLSEWEANVVRPSVGTFDGPLLTPGASYAEADQLQNTVRQLARRDLRPMLESSPATTPAWAKGLQLPGELPVVMDRWVSIVCTYCKPGQSGGRFCPVNFCATDCRGPTGACSVSLQVVDDPTVVN